MIGALLAAESGRHESFADTLGSALLATALYWLAHAYASVLGLRLRGERPLRGVALLRALISEWAIVRGAAIPLAALLLAWAAGASQASAVAIALWSDVATLIVFELLAGIQARARARELLVEAGVGVTLGVGIILLKVLLS